MFEFNPDLVQGDDDEATEDVLQREEQDDEDSNANVKDIDIGMFVPTEIDGTGTRAEDRTIAGAGEGKEPTVNGVVGDGMAFFVFILFFKYIDT